MRKTVISVLTAAFLLVPALALRADGTNAPGTPMISATPGTNGTPRIRVMPSANRAQLPAPRNPMSVLTEEQHASYEKALQALEAQRGNLAELTAKYQAAMRDAKNAPFSGPFDENLIRQKYLAAAEINIDIMMIQLKAFSQIQPPLTPAQLAKFKTGGPAPTPPRMVMRPTPAVNQNSTNSPAKQ
jgi:Spy/CpxP family protein refolding chaperone